MIRLESKVSLQSRIAVAVVVAVADGDAVVVTLAAVFAAVWSSVYR